MVNIPRLSLRSRSVTRRRLLMPGTQITLLLLGFLLTILAVMLSSVKINQVQVKGESGCASVDQIREKSQLKGQSWIAINNDSIKQRLQKQFLCLEEVRARRQLPDIIELQLIERQPVLVVQLASKSSYPDLQALESTSSSLAAQAAFISQSPAVSFLVDRLGVVFSQDLSRAGHLPHIFLIDHPLSLGQQFPGDQESKILAILEKLSQLSIATGQVKLIGQTLVVTGDNQIIFSLEKDDRVQLASLQLILQKAKIDSRPIDRIDLRFDKPVVVYSSVKKN